MMYEKFEEKVLERVRSRIPNGVEVMSCSRRKNNGLIKKGLQFSISGERIEQGIYLDDSYVRFETGQCTMDEIIDGILENLSICDGFISKLNFDPNDFESIKDRIAMKLINTDMNRDFLEEVPNFKFYDLSIVFYLLMEISEHGTGTAQIYNQNVKAWGISKKELLETAIKNSENLLPARFFTMQHAIEEMLQISDNQEEENLFEKKNENKKDVMYVLTNSTKSLGAVCIAYPHVIESIGAMIKEDFYILPSSLHELIIVPQSRALESDEMNAMVQEINSTQVEPEEILCNHAYFYNRLTKKLTY